jgi:hypothetical protein
MPPVTLPVWSELSYGTSGSVQYFVLCDRIRLKAAPSIARESSLSNIYDELSPAITSKRSKKRSDSPVSGNVENENLAEETRALNMSAERADRELESRKSHVLSAMAVRGEQQGGKSGSRRIQSHFVLRRGGSKEDGTRRAHNGDGIEPRR